MNLKGRKKELSLLEFHYQSDRFEFGYLYGPKRIGKTALVEMFVNNKKHLTFYAFDADERSILKAFAESFARQAHLDDIPTIESWSAFFELVGTFFQEGKGVLTIDEYPYIVSDRFGRRKKSTFSSALQRAIDLDFKKKDFLLLLTGSNVSLIEEDIQNVRNPLFSRSDFALPVFRFSLEEASSFLEDVKDLPTKAKLLQLTSTYPYYLSFLDQGKSFEENLLSLFYRTDSPFVRYPESLIAPDFAFFGFNASILTEIAKGNGDYETLAKTLDMESSVLSKHLKVLLSAGLLKKRHRFLSRKGLRYEIEDPLLAYHFLFIRKQAERILLGEGEEIYRKQKNAIANFLDHRFEFLAMDYLSELNKKGMLLTFYESFDHYSAENSRLGRSIEIDCCSESEDNLLIAECKFTKRERSLEDYGDRLEDSKVPPFSSYENKEFYLFGASGFQEDLLGCQDKRLHLVSLEEMLK